MRFLSYACLVNGLVHEDAVAEHVDLLERRACAQCRPDCREVYDEGWGVVRKPLETDKAHHILDGRADQLFRALLTGLCGLRQLRWHELLVHSTFWHNLEPAHIEGKQRVLYEMVPHGRVAELAVDSAIGVVAGKHDPVKPGKYEA